jgi:hypothetical protein
MRRSARPKTNCTAFQTARRVSGLTIRRNVVQAIECLQGCCATAPVAKLRRVDPALFADRATYPRAVAGQNRPQIGKLRVGAVAFDKICDARPCRAHRETGDFQHCQLIGNVAQRDRAATGHFLHRSSRSSCKSSLTTVPALICFGPVGPGTVMSFLATDHLLAELPCPLIWEPRPLRRLAARRR